MEPLANPFQFAVAEDSGNMLLADQFRGAHAKDSLSGWIDIGEFAIHGGCDQHGAGGLEERFSEFGGGGGVSGGSGGEGANQNQDEQRDKRTDHGGSRQAVHRRAPDKPKSDPGEQITDDASHQNPQCLRIDAFQSRHLLLFPNVSRARPPTVTTRNGIGYNIGYNFSVTPSIGVRIR